MRIPMGSSLGEGKRNGRKGCPGNTRKLPGVMDMLDCMDTHPILPNSAIYLCAFIICCLLLYKTVCKSSGEWNWLNLGSWVRKPGGHLGVRRRKQHVESETKPKHTELTKNPEAISSDSLTPGSSCAWNGYGIFVYWDRFFFFSGMRGRMEVRLTSSE